LFAIVLAVFLISKSPGTRLACAVCVAFPLIPVMVGPVYEKVSHWQTERRVRGAETFHSRASRQLAEAIYDHNLAEVQRLLPAAGDLNQKHKEGETLFRFAVNCADASDASFEIIRAMLAAGGNPNFPPGEALGSAIYRGARITKLLLEAGADPNVLDSAQRPVWWGVLMAAYDDDLSTLRVLLDHKADVKKRDREGGPVAWAAYQKCWKAMWLLMQLGAEWKDEQEFGTPVRQMVASAVEYRQHGTGGVPEELRLVSEKFEKEK
jgi:hypothetical protein